MPVRGVVFDLFGTLVEGWGQLTAALKAAEVARILEVPETEFREVMANSYTDRASGRLGPPPEMLRRLCARLGRSPSPEAVARAGQLRLSQFQEVLAEPRPEVTSLLALLRVRGQRLAVISDCSGETPVLWPGLAWARPIQAAVFSFVEGVRKPDQHLYRKAISDLGLEPGECLFVGDGGSQELSGAVRAGMRACQLSVPRLDGDQLLQYDPDPLWDGSVVGSLFAVLPLLAEG
ncbi:MAG: HAD family hydrolase [Candidatus Dormibacteria bacterium]